MFRGVINHLGQVGNHQVDLVDVLLQQIEVRLLLEVELFHVLFQLFIVIILLLGVLGGECRDDVGDLGLVPQGIVHKMPVVE